MTQEYQLRILPEIAANEQKLKEYLSKEKGLNLRDITATRILKRGIYARQRDLRQSEGKGIHQGNAARR